jgi:hypothetical protein
MAFCVIFNSCKCHLYALVVDSDDVLCIIDLVLLLLLKVVGKYVSRI